MNNETQSPIEITAPVTLCFGGPFGYTLVRAKSVKTEMVGYAQYSKALRVEYLEKGKRLRKAQVQTYKPTLVIIEGHVDLKLPDPFETTASGGERTRGSSFDPIWGEEFAKALTASGHKVLRDYRGLNTGENCR